MFAGLILISLLGMGLFGILTACERIFMPWQKVEQKSG